MVLEWSFYAVNQCIDFGGKIDLLENLLRSTLVIDSKTVIPSNDAAHVHYLRRHIKIESEETSSRIILLEEEALEIPTILSFAGNNTVQEMILESLKSEFGAILFPIELDHKLLIEVVDTILDFNRLNSSEFYRTKFLFDVDTHQGSLKRIEIDLNKDTMKTFSLDTEKPIIKDVIIPYIYRETGIEIPKLTLNMIDMTGFAKFARGHIITVSNTLKDEVLLMLLKSAQLD